MPFPDTGTTSFTNRVAVNTFFSEKHSFSQSTKVNGKRTAVAPIDVMNFNSLGLIDSSTAMDHRVDKGYFSESSDILWYRKEIQNPTQARKEWLAQEFLRLIIPSQTETRLAYDQDNDVYYILSKEIVGFKPLPVGEQNKFREGTYKGLGHIIMGAYFIHEGDLKNGNIGTGKDNQVHKIDGDNAFATLQGGQYANMKAVITAVQINRLPFPITYQAYNWLDFYVEGKLASASNIVPSDLNSSASFQKELFEILFKLCLIPNSYFQQFTEAFIVVGAKKYSNFLIERRISLLEQASKVKGFKNYLINQKDNLLVMANNFQKEMEHFVIQGNHPILKITEYEFFRKNAITQLNDVLSVLKIPLEYSIYVGSSSCDVDDQAFVPINQSSIKNLANSRSNSFSFDKKEKRIDLSPDRFFGNRTDSEVLSGLNINEPTEIKRKDSQHNLLASL